MVHDGHLHLSTRHMMMMILFSICSPDSDPESDSEYESEHSEVAAGIENQRTDVYPNVAKE